MAAKPGVLPDLSAKTRFFIYSNPRTSPRAHTLCTAPASPGGVQGMKPK
jgi:hypothetical protein